METLPPTQSKGEITRQAILASAYDLFLDQGFNATSMRQIAERAGLAVGGIYNHFESKEAIFDLLILEKHPYHQVVPVLLSTPGDSLEEFVINAAKTMEAELKQRPDYLKLMFIEIIEFKGRHTPQIFQTVYPKFTQLLDRFAQTDERLREIPLPVVFRSFIMLFLSYFLTRYMINPPFDPEQSFSPDIYQLVDIFLNGIFKSPEIE